MDNQKPKLQQVIDILKAKGTTDEQIAQIAAGLTKAANDQLYAEITNSLTEEDLKAIDACQNQEEANKEILKRYVEKTGQDPDQKVQQFLDLFAEGFLKEYLHPTQPIREPDLG